MVKSGHKPIFHFKQVLSKQSKHIVDTGEAQESRRGWGHSLRSWARLIQRICAVDPLVWPKCAGPMRMIACIEQAVVIHKIPEHPGLWGNRRKPDPRANAPPVLCVVADVDGCLPTPWTPILVVFYGATRASARKTASHALCFC